MSGCRHDSDGGDKEIRTPDLFIANEPLYQLSYIPVRALVVVPQAAISSRFQPGPEGAAASTTQAAPDLLHPCRMRPHSPPCEEIPCLPSAPWSCSSPTPS